MAGRKCKLHMWPSLWMAPIVFLLDGAVSESVLSKDIKPLLAEKLLMITFSSSGFCLFICARPGGNWVILFLPKRYKKGVKPVP